jgi:two-component system, cell cycle response regulator
MTARILVVDDAPTNVKLLERRLSAEYFEVVAAYDGAAAIEACERQGIDVVLLDVMMPEIDGFEVCRRLKANPATAHLPIIMITASDRAQDRVLGLEAGADDFLTKPVNDLELLTRVRSLVRLKMLTDELRLRAATTRTIGMEQLLVGRQEDDSRIARLLVVEDDDDQARAVCAALAQSFIVHVVSTPLDALEAAASGEIECVMVSMGLRDCDPLRLCSQLRNLERSRLVPIILLAEASEEGRLLRGLELGVNDYLVRPLVREELIARLNTQIRRKRYNDRLRSSVIETIELAVTDGLTGLHNRRYLDAHLATLIDRALERRTPLSLMILDIDHFKSVNDRLGHDAGDAVLRQFADRMRSNVRGRDLACRLGGEEFVIVMPDTDRIAAERVAERIREEIAGTAFATRDGIPVAITTSVGIATIRHGEDSVAEIMKRADRALYTAKNDGRNRVVADAA